MIQLVGMLDSPYVRRVAVALLLAEVPFRHRPISLFRHIEAFSQLSPLLKAPSLVLDDGTALVEFERDPRVFGFAPPRARRACSGPGRSADQSGVCDGRRAHGRREGGAGPLRARIARPRRAQRKLAAPASAASSRSALPRSKRSCRKATGSAGKGSACPTSPSLAPGAFVRPRSVISPSSSIPNVIRDFSEFCSRAEELKAFRAAPPIDGAEAPVG